MSIDRAASEFRYQLQRDVELVADRCRQCADETDRLDNERTQFVKDVEKTAAAIRETVSYSIH